MKTFKELSRDEKDLMYKFPAYISLLAANSDGKMDRISKKAAIKFTHIKTFSCDPLLSDFYKEAETFFLRNIEELNDQLPREKSARDKMIKEELSKLESILAKMEPDFAKIMHKSMRSYTEHVSKAHNNVLEYFLIPFYIKGLTC
jgi:hypothetical protein